MSKGFRNIYAKKNGIIYKYISEREIWMQMTGIKNGIDRRFTSAELGGDIEQYRYNTRIARAEVNTYWNSLKDEWSFYGKKYNNSKPLGDFKNVRYFWADDLHQEWFVIKDIPTHEFYTTWTDMLGREHKYSYTWYLVWHQGHIYWMTSYHYMPQCQLYKFNGLDKEPGDFIKWTHIKNLKAVWNKTDKCYV